MKWGASDPASWPQLWDADLLLGRDIVTGKSVTTEDLKGWVGPAVSGGVLGSQRALQFDAESGNAEVHEAASALSLVPSLSLETRDWLGSRAALQQAPDGTVVRLAPQRQDCAPGYPGFRAIVDLCAERKFTILTEGDLRVWGPAFAGRGLNVIFLDAHFYHLGDLVALFGDEPGFRASTRLLNGPDSFDLVISELGIERLIFGSRFGFHEARSAVERLVTSALSDDHKQRIAATNLQDLLGVTK